MNVFFILITYLPKSLQVVVVMMTVEMLVVVVVRKDEYIL